MIVERFIAGIKKLVYKGQVYDEIKEAYDIKSDIKYGAARLWVDEVIDPLDTRKVLIQSLDAISNQRRMDSFNVGVLQV